MGADLRSTSTRRRPRRLLTLGSAVVALVLLASACINDGTWTAAPAPVVPVQGLSTRLSDVSCVSEDWCLAVGTMGRYPVAELWDGSAWSVIPAPSLGYADNTYATSIDCATTTSCLAKVGRFYDTGDYYEDAIAWDGAQWQEVSGGAEGGTLDPLPYGCAADGSCLIVNNGWFETVAWDGTSSTRFPGKPGEDVNAIHCFAADECLAATSSSMFRWDGVAWSFVEGSDYYEIFGAGAASFSCFAADDCLAVGPNLPQTASTSATWDGSTWTEVPLPSGVRYAWNLECVEPDGCLTRSSGTATGGTLAWMNDAWVQATPSPVSTFSCLPRWCLGVGSVGTPAVPTAATYEWTNT
jgi:hypothetical protein